MSHLLDQLRTIVVAAAREELLPRFNRVARDHKEDGSVVTAADYALQQRLADRLSQQWPETLFLGEEMGVQEQASLLASDRPLWCLDPLDGTSNFANGIPYFSVSLALLHDGEVKLGLVYDPLRDECFSASLEVAATLNGQPLKMAKTGLTLEKSTAIIDFKRLEHKLAARLVGDIPYASQRSFGSVALDWCWLAANRGHLYLHGRSNIWDYAAGNFIFQRAGGYSSTLEGDSIFVNALQPRSSVAAVDRSLFEAWTEWLGIGSSDWIREQRTR